MRALLMSGRIVRVAMLISALGVACTSPHSTPATQASDHTEIAATAVRLRKLHLVRPDLIPYPLSLEVYC